MAEDCLTCAHSRPAHGPDGQINFALRECRGGPPTAILVNGPRGPQLTAAFPLVGRGVWCARHQPVTTDEKQDGRKRPDT